MSAPIIDDTYSTVLNASNNFFVKDIIRPAFTNAQFVRLISSNSNAIFQTNFIRASFVLDSTSPQLNQVQGVCYGSEDVWWCVNSNYVDEIQVSVFQHSNPQADAYDLTFQFVQTLGVS
jgi:hypothetical protein